LSCRLCLGISQRRERSAIVSSFGMSFGLVIRGRCMLFSSLHEISKIRSAHLHTDTCQAVFLWSPTRSKKATALAKGFTKRQNNTSLYAIFLLSESSNKR
jgi:hypothetical protein